MHRDRVTKVCNQIYTTLITPITAVSIAGGTVIMITVGMLDGIAGVDIKETMKMVRWSLRNTPIIKTIHKHVYSSIGDILRLYSGS
ncbi:hypothetical protein IFN73_10185, partial [Francisella tularensis subsp. holarctica]|nr:hypothetical protein [Francisella tularensis subsp. holarctica]